MPLKCVFCCHTQPNTTPSSDLFHTHSCIQCHWVTYSCNGMCASTIAIRLAEIKVLHYRDPNLFRKLKRLQTQYHKSTTKLQDHLQEFHGLTSCIPTINVQEDSVNNCSNDITDRLDG